MLPLASDSSNCAMIQITQMNHAIGLYSLFPDYFSSWYHGVLIIFFGKVLIFLKILVAMKTIQNIIFIKVYEENRHFGRLHKLHQVLAPPLIDYNIFTHLCNFCAILSQTLWVIEIFLLLRKFIMLTILHENTEIWQQIYIQCIWRIKWYLDFCSS